MLNQDFCRHYSFFCQLTSVVAIIFGISYGTRVALYASVKKCYRPITILSFDLSLRDASFYTNFFLFDIGLFFC